MKDIYSRNELYVKQCVIFNKRQVAQKMSDMASLFLEMYQLSNSTKERLNENDKLRHAHNSIVHYECLVMMMINNYNYIQYTSALLRLERTMNLLCH